MPDAETFIKERSSTAAQLQDCERTISGLKQMLQYRDQQIAVLKLAEEKSRTKLLAISQESRARLLAQTTTTEAQTTLTQLWVKHVNDGTVLGRSEVGTTVKAGHDACLRSQELEGYTDTSYGQQQYRSRLEELVEHVMLMETSAVRAYQLCTGLKRYFEVADIGDGILGDVFKERDEYKAIIDRMALAVLQLRRSAVDPSRAYSGTYPLAVAQALQTIETVVLGGVPTGGVSKVAKLFGLNRLAAKAARTRLEGQPTVFFEPRSRRVDRTPDTAIAFVR